MANPVAERALRAHRIQPYHGSLRSSAAQYGSWLGKEWSGRDRNRNRFILERLLPGEEDIRAKAKLFDSWLKRLKFNDIQVNTFSGVATPEQLGVDEKPTFGVIGALAHDTAFVSFLAASMDPRVRTVFVTATDKNSGLLGRWNGVNDSKLYTDSFWVLENGVMQHITPTEPIPLDGINMCWDKENIDPVLKYQYSRTALDVNSVGADKLYAKQLLQKAGVYVAPFAFGDGPRVAKDPFKEYGMGVVLGKPGEEQYEREKAKLISEAMIGFQIFEEERFFPPPLPELAAILNKDRGDLPLVADDEVDLCIRHIFGLGEEPSFILSFLKFDRRANSPISVTLGAKFAPIEALGNSEWIRLADENAKATVSALYKRLHYRGDPASSPILYGVDTILDGAEYNYHRGIVRAATAEAQPNTGGFQLLQDLAAQSADRALVQTVGNRIVTHQLPSLQAKFDARLPFVPHDLQSLPRIPHDPNNIYTIHADRTPSGTRILL